MYFVRLQGCDVGCYFCDTKYTWRDKNPDKDESDIVKRAFIQASWMCITGGEPYEQNLKPLVNKAHEYGLKVHVETSGGAPWQDTSIDWVCLSPKDLFTKKQFQTHQEFKEKANEIKCVVTKEEDVAYYINNYAKFCRAEKPLIFQPVDNKTDLVEYILDMITVTGLSNRARCMLQVHKIMEMR